MSQLALSGEVEYLDVEPDQIPQLKSEVHALRQQVELLRQEMETVKALLRRQYAAFAKSFGDAAVPTTEDASDKWAVIKQKLPPRLRECIDILLLQGTMKRTQISAAMKMDYTNCNKNVIGVLVKQGWVVDNGGSLSVRQL